MSTISITNCKQCGAEIAGSVCEYCGALGYVDPSSSQQIQALEVYHDLLAAKDNAARINLLKNGFLPDNKRVLIEAGLRCMPLIGHEDIGEASLTAVGRLQAIVLKLKLMPRDSEISRAISEFETKIRDYEKRETKYVLIGVGLLTGLAAAGLVLFLLYRFLS